MTRASLLHILDHVSAISDAEVRELEQLATAFPYCQTAHLLLAKAAHDKGSMLAGQRLRRAATYAPNRQLLRQLIDLPVPAAAPLLPAADAPAAPLLPPEVPAAATVPTAIVAAPAVGAKLLEAPTTVEPVETPAATEPASASERTITPEEDTTGAALLPAAADQQAASSVAEDDPAKAAGSPAEIVGVAVEAVAATADSALDRAEPPPAAAPLICPPPSEFVLDDASPDYAAYALTAAPLKGPVVTASAPPFYADGEIGYAFDGGSRLGPCLRAHDELTRDLPAAEFFPPDALLLAHAADQTPVSAAPSSLAIIERFLQQQPRLRPPAAPAAPDDEQADLSVASTSVTPALASESLATIMVRQGKTAKAIEIYERLMVRQPEKKAYFAAQIDQLKQSE